MENDPDMSLEVEEMRKLLRSNPKGKGKAVNKAGNFQLDSFFWLTGLPKVSPPRKIQRKIHYGEDSTSAETSGGTSIPESAGDDVDMSMVQRTTMKQIRGQMTIWLHQGTKSITTETAGKEQEG